MRRLLAIAAALLVAGGLGSLLSSSTSQAQTSSPGFNYPLGPPDGAGYAANGFGFLEHAYYGERCGWVFHPGEDWNDEKHGDDSSDPIHAVADGVIVEARTPSGAGDGWGHLLLIRHDGDFALPEGGSISTVWSQYGHMGSIATNPRTGNPWKPDDSVFRGEQIGSVGDYPYLSGNAFHLHFEIRKQRLHSAGSFPCSKPDAYVRARYTEPSAFIALNRPSAPPGAGDGVPWPMFGHDAQHTSQTPLLGPVPADLTWSFDAGQELGEPPVVGTDGTVYLAGRFSLWALSSTGEQQWAIPAGFINASPALSPAGSTLYVNDFVDGLRAHSVADGSTLWTRRLGSLCSGPTVDSEGTIYIGSCSGVLYGLDPDGSTRFATRVSNTGDPNADAIHAYPTQSNGGLTYVVTRGGRVFAVDSVGDLVRQYPSSGSLGEVLSTPAIGSTGELYVPIWAGVARVVAVSASGEEQWRLAHNPETVEQVGFAIAHDGTLLVQAGEDVMAVDPGTGLVLWEQKGLAAVSGGISIGGDGTIYVSGKDGDMVLLGPNGSTMSAGSGGCFAQGPPVIGIDRSAFVFESSSCGDFLHAFTGSS